MRVNLHLGAHKTATTSLQAVLKKNRRLLSENDIFYYPREEFRDEVTRPYFYPRVLKKSGKVRLLDVIQDSGLYRGEEKVVISEENLLSLVQEIFVREEFYPSAGERLEKMKYFFDGVEVDGVFFTVREYVGFIPSVYTQINKSLKFVDFEGFKKNFSSWGFSWLSVVEDIS
ncbi:hypothetical protein [Halomonas elongata]|uniref:hypothetical protein n=1 Tax=Halomonas elongata TaxID=2746 RepID=UPI0023AFCAA7|nr:hypothetical protein [Halomonas elongata]